MCAIQYFYAYSRRFTVTESIQASFYGIKSVNTVDLVPMVEAGHEQACDELKERLPQ